MAATTTTTTYSVNNGSVTTTKTVKSNIYNDKGCDNIGSCANYGAWTKCLVDLYHGVDVCQNIYILDANGQPMDLERLDKIELVLTNEFGCPEMSTEHGISVKSLQQTYYGDLFKINPENFWDMESKYFDLHNVRIADDSLPICPDDTTAIVLGEYGDNYACEGHIIFNPFDYSGDLFVEIDSHDCNTGKCIVMINGLPQPITFNKKNKLVNVLDGCTKSIITLMSVGPDFEQTQALLKSIDFSCTKGYLNKGLVQICYSGAKIPRLAGKLTAEIALKFNAQDDEEPDATKVISCFPIAYVRQSMILAGAEPPEEDEVDNEVFTIIPVDKLPVADWNTMNRIYLIKSKFTSRENESIEYVTVKTKVNGRYSYHWERAGDNYDIVATQAGDRAAGITLTNDDDTDTIVLKHVDQENGNGSMIDFNADGNAINANITRIDGGVL